MHDQVSHELISAAHGWEGGQPGEELKRATGLFLARTKQDPSLLGRISASLAVLDPGAAAWVAVSCGSAVERGADPELSAKAILDLLTSWLPRLPRADEQPTAEQAVLLKLFDFLCRAAVTHLAGSPALREQMGRDLQLIERLDELSVHGSGALWVREALLKSSGSLVVIHVTSARALRIRYTNVSNCFHLFSLLQTAIGQRLEGGRMPDEAVAKVARGASSENITDEAWWHYGDPQSRKADVMRSIWGEALTREIPVVDGVQVMLAWPPLLQGRVWDAAFLAPHLEAMPADAVVEAELTADEVSAWLKRLGIESPVTRRPWWRFGR